METEIIKNEGGKEEYIRRIEKIENLIIEKCDKEDVDFVKSELRYIEKLYFDYSDYWIKKHYKLGVLDGISLKEELKSLNKNSNCENVINNLIFNKVDIEFEQIMEEYRRKVLYKNEEYNELKDKIKIIKEKYPKVLEFLENNEINEFTVEESEAILKIIKAEDKINVIETEEAFKLGNSKNYN